MNDERDIDMIAALAHAGIGKDAIEAVMAIDAMMQQWRRRAAKRELGKRALIDLDIGLDLAQLDVLTAIEAPRNEFGETGSDETMVATVAERLGIDPSRASRLASEMVEAGYAIRSVSQADARRTIIALTDSGRAVVDAVRTYKFLLMGDFMSNWSSEDLSRFVPLLQRFSVWTEESEQRKSRFEAEIGGLAARIAAERKALELKKQA